MNDPELIPAATVILLRDGSDGLEVLMLKRNSKIAFGGMWVFPGGRVDPEDRADDEEIDAAKRAAIREAHEEAGVSLGDSDIVAWAYWVPPKNIDSYVKAARRRYSTWFFVAAAPDGDIEIDMGEIHDHDWMSPAAAMAKRDDGVYELAPPTFVTLHQLSAFGSVDEILAHAKALKVVPDFRTRPVAGEPITLLWAGDHEYPDGEASPPGTLHRLILDPKGWVYHPNH